MKYLLICSISLLFLISCHQTNRKEPPDQFELYDQMNEYWEIAKKTWDYTQMKDSSEVIAERYWNFRNVTDDTSLLNLTSRTCFEILYTFHHYDNLKEKYYSLTVNDPSLVSLVTYIPVITDGSEEKSYIEWIRILRNTENRYIQASSLAQLARLNFRQQNFQAANFFLDTLKFFKHEIDSLGLDSELNKIYTSARLESNHQENPLHQSYLHAFDGLKSAFYKHRLNIGSMYGYRMLLSNNYLKEHEPDLKAVMNYLGNYPAGNTSKPRCGMLFYDYQEPYLRIWIITPDVIQAFEEVVIDSESLLSGIDNLRNSLGLNVLQENRTPRKANVVHQESTCQTWLNPDQAIAEVSRLLFPGTIAAGLESFTHVIIIPALNLSSVPFSILRPFTDSSQVIDKFTLSVAPSLYDLIKPEIHGHFNYYEKWSWEHLKENPLIVGDPFVVADSMYYFPPLPGAKNEAVRIAELLNSESLIAEKARKDTIASRAKTASLIYLATHGISDNEDPLNGSFLALSGDDFKSSMWTLYEIQRTPMKAHLAVLSACQTGLGQVYDAGILGIARGFQISGVPRIVISLWNVDDAATEAMMLKFMTNLKSEYPADALRSAMLEMRKENPDPLFWASFTIFGTLW